MESSSIAPLLVLLAPVLGAAGTAALRDHPPGRELCCVGAGVVQLIVIATMVPTVTDGGTISFTISSFLPQADIGLRVDALGVILAGTSSLLWVLTTVYSMGYLGTGQDRSLARFHVFFGLTIGATVGVAFSVNLLTLYVFYEALTIITFPLVTHARTPEAARGGRRYLTYQLGTGIAFLLPAIVLTYTQSGTFDFVPGGVFDKDAGGTVMVVIYVLFLAGIAKAALLPVHAWLPAAMVAPVPVSALLHAVAVVNVGVFTVFRIVMDVFGTELLAKLHLGTITLVVTSATILMTSLYALRLDNLKAILAYSTIGQLSYMMLGVALLNEAGRTGGILHLIGHAFAKITLFFAVGSVYLASKRTAASDLRGLARRMPWTMGAFAVGALSIIGLPPTVGFIAKYLLFLGAVDAGQWLVVVVLAISTVLSAGYYVRMLRLALLEAPTGVTRESSDGPGRRRDPPIVESPLLVVAPLVVTAAITLLLGVAPGALLGLVRAAAGAG